MQTPTNHSRDEVIEYRSSYGIIKIVVLIAILASIGIMIYLHAFSAIGDFFTNHLWWILGAIIICAVLSLIFFTKLWKKIKLGGILKWLGIIVLLALLFWVAFRVYNTWKGKPDRPADNSSYIQKEQSAPAAIELQIGKNLLEPGKKYSFYRDRGFAYSTSKEYCNAILFVSKGNTSWEVHFDEKGEGYRTNVKDDDLSMGTYFVKTDSTIVIDIKEKN